MGSIVSFNPANGASVGAGTDLTVVLLTTSKIYSLSVEAGGEEFTACSSGGDWNLLYGIYSGTDANGYHVSNVFIPGSLLSSGSNKIWFYGIYYDDDAMEESVTYYGVSYGNCTPPSNPVLSASETTGSATLSWTAGGAGTNNAVTGYVITYQDSADGSSWGEVGYLKEVTGTSTTVDAPGTTGYYRRFGIQTKGAAGDNYLSTVVWSGSLKKIAYTACGAPTSPTLGATISRDAVLLSWGAGSAGTNNAVAGYDVQYRESSDGSSWGSWTTASGSPVTATSLSVAPSSTVGNYRQYRVRTRGSAGESYYSAWVTSTNTLRRKWAAFGSYTDAALTARTSMIRAVHLTELQVRVNTIRAFYGLGAYSFTTITARASQIAKWESLIGEIRDAIDGITTAHDSWNTLEAGKPRIAHITQIRGIIDSM